MFLGYTRDEDDNLVIVPEEAKVIKYIFDLFLQGHSAYDISKILMKEGFKTGAKKDNWNSNSVLRILQNEKYSGDAILQKTYTVDYLTQKSVPNDNIVDKYYVTNSHEGIVSKEDFQMVQEIIKKQNEDLIDLPKNSKFPLTNLVFCSNCKRPMKRHVHNYKRKSEKIVLNCNHAPKNRNIKCDSKVIENNVVLSALDDAITSLVPKNKLNGKLINTLNKSLNRGKLRAELAELQSKVTKYSDQLETFVNSNMKLLKDNPDEFNNTYLKLKNKIELKNERISKINLELSNDLVNESRLDIINNFINNTASVKDGIIIKTMFKLIIVTPDNELLIILNGDTYKISEILNDFTILDNASVLIDKTHFDKELNTNVKYKVVIIDEK